MSRLKWSFDQRHALEAAFYANPRPPRHALGLLASQLNVTTRHVIVWFQNTRQRRRLELKRREVMLLAASVVDDDVFDPEHVSSIAVLVELDFESVRRAILACRKCRK